MNGMRIERIMAALLVGVGLWAGVGEAARGEESAMDKTLATLPVYRPARAKVDWLIDPTPYKAAAYRSEPGELVLSNGLVSRTFRLTPNGATVGFDQLVTGQALIRGVKPEARVTIDGVAYDVGGLVGQPNYAYLKPEWLAALRADPQAFRLVGFEIGQPVERLAWKRVRHCAPDAVWPPKGVAVRMDYEMSEAALVKAGSAPAIEDKTRPVLLSETFDKLDKAWRVHATKAHPRSSFQNEGKVGEIYTPGNTAVFAERDLPKGVRVVEATIDAGTDRTSSWGPGLAVVWPGRTIKFNLRPGGSAEGTEPQFGTFDGRAERVHKAGLKPDSLAKPWTLRIRITDAAVYCEAGQAGGAFRTIHVIRLRKALGDPKAVRVGKMGKTGGSGDFGGEKGELVRLRVLGVRALGAPDPAALAARSRKLAASAKIRVSVHYELYDGIPCLSKWITVHNPTTKAVVLNRFTCEVLAAVERSSSVEFRDRELSRPNIHVESDYAFAGFTPVNTTKWAVHWVPDPQYHTQVNYRKLTPCQLEVRPIVGPEQTIEPGKTFESFRAFLLPQDSTCRERKGLALRRMYRVIAPWVTENPLMHHMRIARPDLVRKAVDQAAEVGFEMIILSFGSGFNMENDSPNYLATWKAVADYAHSKGLEIGSYSLLASRRVGGGNDVVSPPGESPTFGNCPALTSKWGQDYFRKLYEFFPTTGFDLLEHDGSYPGDRDVTPRPPLQKGALDSRWVQWRIITDFYRFCRARGVYLNVPDYYYLAGSNKCGMGYREVNWSLPRAQQVIHTRQNIFDGSWQKTPSMGWMFVPLTQYHGGGAAATIEPLDKHLGHYERMLYSNLALGVQACYRGPRLFDTDRTKALVKKWVDWFKKYRGILESDLIHGRRADAREVDWMLHVNPQLKHKGLLVVFNPLTKPVTRTLHVNLYYTGLTDTAQIRAGEGPAKKYKLDRDYNVDLPVEVPAEGMAWHVIE